MHVKLQSMMRYVAGCLLIAVCCPGCRKPVEAPATLPTNEKATSAAVVTVARPQRKTLVAKTTQPARIEAFEETPLVAKIAGYVADLKADIGDRISKDQILVTLRAAELADDVQQKTALVAEAEAEIKQAEAAVVAANAAADTATAHIAESQADIARTASEYDRWQSEYERIKSLAESGSVTQKLKEETLNQFRAAEASRNAANAAVRSAEAAERQAKADSVKADADRVATEAKLGVATAELARAKTMFDYTLIRSPFDGVVTKRAVDTGHYVQPAATNAAPIMTVARTDKVRVFVDIPELEASGVEVGCPAIIRSQGLPNEEIHGSVTRTSWSLDAVNRALRAEIDVPNEAARLRPGAYATVTIDMAHHENALTIPTTAVARDGTSSYCFVVQDGKAERRNLQIGLRMGTDAEVVEGVSDDEDVVQTHPEALSAGQAVRITSPSK
jgi:HlyD family secretion protein